MAEAIDRCAFACLPTHFETFGMVAVEVMARSRAVIFTNTTSGPEIITHGVDGLTVNPHDVGAIAQAMEQLITNPELRDRLAQQGYQTVSTRYPSNIIVDQLESFYLSLCQ